MNALKLVEAVHFDPSGIPSYKKDHVTDKDRRDPEKQRFRTLPGEIVTRPRHGSSIRTRGGPLCGHPPSARSGRCPESEART